MSIEKVEIVKTIVAGDLTWEKGTVLPKDGEPLPPIVLDEIIQKTGTVKVLSYTPDVVTEKTGLVIPLNDSKLTEAHWNEEELQQKLVEEKNRADEAERMSKVFSESLQETKEAIEAWKMAFDALASRVKEIEESIKTFNTAFGGFRYETKKTFTDFEDRIFAVEESILGASNVKEPSKQTRKEVTPVKKKKLASRSK